MKAKHSVKGAGGGAKGREALTEKETRNVKEILRAFTFEEKNEASQSLLFVKLQSALILLVAQFCSGAFCRELLEQRHTVGNCSHQSDTCKPYNATSLSFVIENNSHTGSLCCTGDTSRLCCHFTPFIWERVCDDAPIL